MERRLFQTAADGYFPAKILEFFFFYKYTHVSSLSDEHISIPNEKILAPLPIWDL